MELLAIGSCSRVALVPRGTRALLEVAPAGVLCVVNAMPSLFCWKHFHVFTTFFFFLRPFFLSIACLEYSVCALISKFQKACTTTAFSFFFFFFFF
ncbi:hypothetical protein BC828DRAFT_373594, partial [Blastocladiella britannica]